jgi:hypothetical protein
MPIKWSNDLSIQLIESYKTFECLWNPTHTKYKCRNEKHDAWAKLSEATGADEAEVKRKILLHSLTENARNTVPPKICFLFLFLLLKIM